MGLKERKKKTAEDRPEWGHKIARRAETQSYVYLLTAPWLGGLFKVSFPCQVRLA